MAFKLSNRREIVPPEGLATAAVPTDQRIVPGKGVGTYALDAPIADLNTRLGPFILGQHGWGMRAQPIVWPNGLTGYVDADHTRLLGLETADRAHRTERGVGFGSSQGAVRLAHGAPSATIELQNPGVGGVRVMIYNDQGIAFAITADKAHADRKGHAPIGAVDWITVFPAGGAAALFPLP